MILTNEWLRTAEWLSPGYARRAAICKSGLILSIQAGQYHYCFPREDGAQAYTSVEVGFPVKGGKPVRLRTLRGSRGIYPFASVEKLDRIIRRNGGVIGGQ